MTMLLEEGAYLVTRESGRGGEVSRDRERGRKEKKERGKKKTRPQKRPGECAVACWGGPAVCPLWVLGATLPRRSALPSATLPPSSTAPLSSADRTLDWL
uniref:Uncharacterized protein n=1 Tax=Bursaphelenchus xylophilus TaxID=6326 RepID=A0A1I7SVP3_BURXY